jgi:NAD(P)-dependent dehydrogenase (short-subunit alcohol dehydrogenase family)
MVAQECVVGIAKGVEVMEMNGKHVAITGPTAGIGRCAAMELARRGARLTLFCRNTEKGREVQREIEAAGGLCPDIIHLDMAELSSVRRAAGEFLSRNDSLDILLNNAGIVNTSRRETVDGFEESLAVNHFAPFLLTGLLLRALQKAGSARVVNVASDAHAFVRGMRFEDMQAEQGYKTFREYGRSKLANILFTRALAARLSGQNITVNCLHPGAVATSLAKQNKSIMSKILPVLLKPFFRSPEQGAQTSIYLCASDAVADTSGEYFANCKQVSARPWARDDEAAARLWSYTEECIDFRYPA